VKYLGVISGVGKKSLSPVFQQAALDALGMDIVYEAWPTPPDGLATRMMTLRGEAVLGANVTIPHKEEAFRRVEEVDETAGRTGAVNTIVNRGGRLSGHNTDVDGFLRGLREDGGLDPAGKRAVVAGAGGSARAVVVALLDSGAASVTVINRDAARAVRLAEDLGSSVRETRLQALPATNDSWSAATADCELLINCTSAGSDPGPDDGERLQSAVPLDVLHPGMLVYDLIYLPSETPLLAAAKARGARVVGGLPMLIYQGAASFQLWTGREAPIEVMFDAARGALGAEVA
jgi:shikimate dehydrogenase